MTVLIVDDLPDNLELLRQMLADNHLDARAATNGPDALEELREHPADLVLLDIMMPGMDGLEVLDRLKADPATRDIPVMMVTAYDDDPLLSKAFAAGAIDFVRKPVEEKELVARVRSGIALKRTQDALRKEGEELARRNTSLASVNDRLQHTTKELQEENRRLTDELK